MRLGEEAGFSFLDFDDLAPNDFDLGALRSSARSCASSGVLA